MANRYDAVAVREYEVNGETRTAFTNIGVAFPLKEKDGFSLRLHCLPAPMEGEYRILLFPPKPKDDDAPSRRQEPSRQSSYAERSGARMTERELDDEIPF